MNNTQVKLAEKPAEYWKEKLTPEQFDVCFLKATETPFSGELLGNKQKGMYHCAVCNQELFNSDTKFESGSGWPSFFSAMGADKVKLVDDFSHGMNRVEVECGNCGSHLGHLFDDGPAPSGKRFCINSVALKFEAKLI